MPEYRRLTSLGLHGVNLSRAREGTISKEALDPGEERGRQTSDKEAIVEAYPGMSHHHWSEPMTCTMATHWFCCQW